MPNTTETPATDPTLDGDALPEVVGAPAAAPGGDVMNFTPSPQPDPPTGKPLVILKDDAARGLTAGEIVLTTVSDQRALKAADIGRDATEADVALAQPRLRAWSSKA